MRSMKSQWLVRLKGEVPDLEDLSELFVSEELSVIKERGSFWMRSSRFASLVDNTLVYSRALDLIRLMNGAAKVHYGDFRPVEFDGITRVDDEGNWGTHTHFGSTRVTGGGRVRVKTVASPEAKGERPPPERWVELALREETVARALRMLSRDTSWSDLYKVYEIVRHDVGGRKGITEKRWASRNQIDRFTGTADSWDVLGENARHGVQRRDPPPNPMGLEEARSLVRTIVVLWLGSKHAPQPREDDLRRAPSTRGKVAGSGPLEVR